MPICSEFFLFPSSTSVFTFVGIVRCALQSAPKWEKRPKNKKIFGKFGTSKKKLSNSTPRNLWFCRKSNLCPLKLLPIERQGRKTGWGFSNNIWTRKRKLNLLVKNTNGWYGRNTTLRQFILLQIERKGRGKGWGLSEDLDAYFGKIWMFFFKHPKNWFGGQKRALYLGRAANGWAPHPPCATWVTSASGRFFKNPNQWQRVIIARFVVNWFSNVPIIVCRVAIMCPDLRVVVINY